MPQTLELRPATARRAEPRLVSDAREGDDRAFEELYSRYRERIFAFILSRVHDHGRAEDIAQEVFMSALRQLRTTDQEIVLQPWLYTIAKNACIDESRRVARGTAVPVGSDDELPAGQVPLLSLVPSPDDAIESKQRLRDLRSAFGGLSDTHRRLLVMREFEGRSYAEIGEQLAMNRQMVESGLFRARRKLGSEYDELASGRRCEQIVDAISSGAFETVQGLGLKERRRATRHLSHCQNCRHHAMMAGVDQALLKPRSIADKLAALLPFGIWRKLWPYAGGGSGKTAGRAKATGALGGTAQAAGPVATESSISLGTAAVAAAVAAIAGAGGGVALTQGHSSHAAPAHVSHSPAAADSSGTADHVTGAAAADHRLHALLAAGAKSGGWAGARASQLHSAKLLGATHPGGGAGGKLGGGGSAGGGHGGKSTGGGGGPSGGGSGSGGGSSSGGGSTGAGGTGHNANHVIGTTVGQTRKTLSQTGNALGGVVSGTGKTVGGVVSQTGNNVGNTVSQTGNTVGNTVSQTGNAVGNTVSQTGNTVGNTVSQTGNTVGNTVSQTGNTVGNTVSQTGNTVGNTVGQVGNAVGSTVNTVAPGVGSTVSGVTHTAGGVVGQASSAVGSTVSQTSNAAGSTVSQTSNTAGSTVSGVTSTVGSSVSQTGKTAGSAVSGVTGVVGGVLGGGH